MAGFGVEGKKTHVSGEQVRIAEGGYPGTLQREEERARSGCIKSIIYPFNLSSVLRREEGLNTVYTQLLDVWRGRRGNPDRGGTTGGNNGRTSRATSEKKKREQKVPKKSGGGGGSN